MRQWIPFAVAVVLAVPQVASALGWSGRVSDRTSGKVIVGARVCAGIVGRVDVACVQSASDGMFVVNYPVGFTAAEYALYVDGPTGSTYYNQARVRPSPSPTPVEVRLVAMNGYLKGVVTAEGGPAVVSGASVTLIKPGAGVAVTKTDVGGSFNLGPYQCYDVIPAQFNSFDVPDSEVHPSTKDRPHNLIPYGLEVSAPGFVTSTSTLSGGTYSPAVQCIPSVDNSTYASSTVNLRRPGGTGGGTGGSGGSGGGTGGSGGGASTGTGGGSGAGGGAGEQKGACSVVSGLSIAGLALVGLLRRRKGSREIG